MKSAKDIWNNFWFAPASPSPICLFRIAYGLLVLTTGLLLAPDLFTWFGDGGVISQQTIHDWENSEARFSLFFLLPETHNVVLAVYAALMLSAFFLTLGFFTRLSATVVFICLVSFDQRMACIFNAGDTVLRHQALLLSLSKAGALYSVDYLRTKSKQPALNQSLLRSPWAQRLIQLQLTGVYCQTFFSKVECSQWLDGSAMYYCSRLVDFARMPLPFVFDHIWGCQLICWMTLAIEFALFTLIWLPRWRYRVLAAAIVFHMCIDWSMNIPVFEYVMIATYLNFLKPEDASALANFVQSFFQKHVFPRSISSKSVK